MKTSKGPLDFMSDMNVVCGWRNHELPVMTVLTYNRLTQYALTIQRVNTFNVVTNCNASNLLLLKNAKTCRN